jgi:1-acyl-sn-glycerol-3-phosphate acyltransferase
MPLAPLSDPPKLKRRLGGLARGAPPAAVLASSLLLINVGQMLSLATLPFSRKTFRGINRWFADTWCGWTVKAADIFQNIKARISGDDLPMRENAVVFSNHQQMPDITFLLFLARTKGTLGDVKWFAKDIIKYVPTIGWGMAFLGCPFVKRDWNKDRENIARTFSAIVNEKLPVWLVTFPEGTRVTPDKLEQGKQYAREKGITPPRHTLLPRTKGFVASVQGLRSHIGAVYDVTIGYEDGVPTLWQYVKGYAKTAHLHVRRYPIGDLPESDDELAEWLLERFREKDQLLEGFYTHGEFRD